MLKKHHPGSYSPGMQVGVDKENPASRREETVTSGIPIRLTVPFKTPSSVYGEAVILGAGSVDAWDHKQDFIRASKIGRDS